MALDLEFIRSHFPALARGWALFDNAGASVVPRQVSERVGYFLSSLRVQLGASYALSVEAKAAVNAGTEAAAALVGASPDQVVISGSTTHNAYVLAHALGATMQPGDEIIVTNLDHEANIGAWARLAERGMVVRQWRYHPETLRLELDDLTPLLNRRTRLVCCAQVSNLIGAIHDVRTIAERAHAVGALVCVDGVAYAPHRRVDVTALGVDFYLLSLYKLFGPHLGILYIRPEHIKTLPNQHHFFVAEPPSPYKFQLGGVNNELVAGIPGVLDYFRAVDDHHHDAQAAPAAPAAGADTGAMLTRVFASFAAHEAELAGQLLDFLRARRGVRVLGPVRADAAQRVATISFVVEGRDAGEIPPLLEPARIATRAGHFYARRLATDLGLDPAGGAVRISMAHYNTADEVTRLIAALDQVL